MSAFDIVGCVVAYLAVGGVVGAVGGRRLALWVEVSERRVREDQPMWEGVLVFTWGVLVPIALVAQTFVWVARLPSFIRIVYKRLRSVRLRRRRSSREPTEPETF